MHILGRREDGWHELESLVAFSRFGDLLHFFPADPLGLSLAGPHALSCGEPEDNLILKAARNLQRLVPGLKLGRFHLGKRLPVAAGIGGGSSDAAAALRLLARANGLGLDDPRMLQAAAETGSDVPVCMSAKARMMAGLGERLGPVLKLPPLAGLIINPGIPVETKPVFQRLNIVPGEKTGLGPHPDFASSLQPDVLWPVLKKGRNDMEPAATVIAPIIGDVLAILGGAPGCRIARMSGSGATCFGLFDSCRNALKVRAVIKAAHPDWWVKACVLN